GQGLPHRDLPDGEVPRRHARRRAHHHLRHRPLRGQCLPAAGPRAHRARRLALTAVEDADVAVPGGVITRRGAEQAFTVHLDNFEGPFDLLLGLISKHQLDITEVSLARVTDEFIAHLRALRESAPDLDLGETSEFVLVAATLLDLKASRLLPNTSEGDEEDLELIEARDLLFARLLQYRALKDVAAHFEETMATSGLMTPRQAGLEPHLAGLLPELVMNVTPTQLAV